MIHNSTDKAYMQNCHISVLNSDYILQPTRQRQRAIGLASTYLRKHEV